MEVRGFDPRLRHPKTVKRQKMDSNNSGEWEYIVVDESTVSGNYTKIRGHRVGENSEINRVNEATLTENIHGEVHLNRDKHGTVVVYRDNKQLLSLLEDDIRMLHRKRMLTERLTEEFLRSF